MNDAASRLHAYFTAGPLDRVKWMPKEEIVVLLKAALAAERRATVERVRAAVEPLRATEVGRGLTIRILAILDAEAERAGAVRRERVAMTPQEALAAAGFSPDFNVCRSCKHHGSRHDLRNRCMDCIEQMNDRFTMMSEDEQWEHGLAALAAAGFAIVPADTGAGEP